MQHFKSLAALLLLAVAGCADGPTSNSSINHKFSLTQAQRNDSNGCAPGPGKADDFTKYYGGYSEDVTRNTRTSSGYVGTFHEYPMAQSAASARSFDGRPGHYARGGY